MTERGIKDPLGHDSGVPSNPNKRRRKDRRINYKASLKYLLLNGRREKIRRDDDRQRVFFFDRYNPKLFAAITAILMLSVTDAFLTLILIANGSTELNPVMAYFIEHSLLHFIIAKYALTSAGVLILLIFKNVLITRAKIYTSTLFSAVIIAFSAVVVWEIFLIIRIL